MNILLLLLITSTLTGVDGRVQRPTTPNHAPAIGGRTAMAEAKCSRCSLVKGLDRFQIRATVPSGHNGVCKDCRAEQARVNQRKPGRAAINSATQRRYRDRTPHQQQARWKKWLRDNPARAANNARLWAANNPGRKRAILKAWREANPRQAAVLNARANDIRRAREAAVVSEIVDRHVVFARDGWICGICGLPVAAVDASLDHIVPIAKGGPHAYGNCQTAHLKCNLSKGAKSPETVA